MNVPFVFRPLPVVPFVTAPARPATPEVPLVWGVRANVVWGDRVA